MFQFNLQATLGGTKKGADSTMTEASEGSTDSEATDTEGTSAYESSVGTSAHESTMAASGGESESLSSRTAPPSTSSVKSGATQLSARPSSVNSGATQSSARPSSVKSLRRSQDKSQLSQSTSGRDSQRPPSPSLKHTSATDEPAPPRQSKAPGGPRRVFVMRHGERMDRIFPTWTRLAFDNNRYRPYDLNQPLDLPLRRGGVAAYQSDPPLTEMGQVTVQMVARGMRLRGQRPSAIYCSPALRCVQTAATVARTVGSPTPSVRVEPGLFEWLAWLGNRGADFLTPAELRDAKLTVDERYQPLVSVAALGARRHETPAESYERCVSVVQRVLERDDDAATLLFVGHAQTVDAVARSLVGKTDTVPLARQQMDRLGFNYPYCATVGMSREGSGAWRLLHDALPSITTAESSNRINHQFFNR